ncbi:hypothetical protein ACG7TL_005948 [Trametes sanguinea]
MGVPLASELSSQEYTRTLSILSTSTGDPGTETEPARTVDELDRNVHPVAYLLVSSRLQIASDILSASTGTRTTSFLPARRHPPPYFHPRRLPIPPTHTRAPELLLSDSTMPFKIPSVRLAQASPSISLEKGSYRLRAPPSRLSPSSSSAASSTPASAPHQSPTPSGARRDGSRPASTTVLVPASYEKRMALLVAVLACAMLASFGTAYWLWSTGLRVHGHGHGS